MTMGTRKSPLRRTGIARGTKTLKPVGEGKRKKMARYKAKLAAYRKSETYTLVEARAGGQCERIYPAGEMARWSIPSATLRCAYRGPLTHNHTTYARFGGKELPEDVEALCPAHHAEYENARPWRAASRRQATHPRSV